MELEGIYQVAQCICGQRQFRKKNVTVFSDNQAAVRRAGQLSPGQGQHLSRKLHDFALQQCQHGGSLQVEWVPGHWEVDGNEKADTLAKAGVLHDPRRRETSRTHLQRCIKEHYYNQWEAKWNSIPLDLKGHSYVGNWKRKPDKLFHNGHIICSTVMQMRTGHGPFASYLHRMGFHDNDRCLSCPSGPHETPQHLLFHCPQYSKARLIAAKKCRILLHTKAFIYSDIAHTALAEVIRNTRLGTRMVRPIKEEERAGIREAQNENDVDKDEREDDDLEEWEEDEELVGAEVAPVIPEEALVAAGRWLFDEFGGAQSAV
jgi:hypothetical protein